MISRSPCGAGMASLRSCKRNWADIPGRAQPNVTLRLIFEKLDFGVRAASLVLVALLTLVVYARHGAIMGSKEPDVPRREIACRWHFCGTVPRGVFGTKRRGFHASEKALTAGYGPNRPPRVQKMSSATEAKAELTFYNPARRVVNSHDDLRSPCKTFPRIKTGAYAPPSIFLIWWAKSENCAFLRQQTLLPVRPCSP